MRRERPWLKAKPSERLFENLRIAILQGDDVFGRALAEELEARSGEFSEEQTADLRHLKENLARVKD